MWILLCSGCELSIALQDATNAVEETGSVPRSTVVTLNRIKFERTTNEILPRSVTYVVIDVDVVENFIQKQMQKSAAASKTNAAASSTSSISS